jgi:TonB family protein
MRRSIVLLLVLAGAVAMAFGTGSKVAPPGATGHCAPSLQAYFAKDFTDQAYQHKAYQKVAGQWKRPASDPRPGSKAVVIATIARDGKAPSPTLHMKSGSESWDAAALAAVKAAAPFDPLPASYPQPSVEVHFHFACGG